jgi:outer membrane receptor for ferrienterochelin and colicins
MRKAYLISRIRLTFGLMILVLSCITSQTLAEQQQEPNKSESLFDLPLETLMNVEVTSASKKAESLYEAPAVMSVVPREEIDAYGDRNLHQLLQRQPSIYTRGSYLYPHNLASFRGDMATQLDLHTLVLFNGRPIRGSSFGGSNFPVYMTLPLSALDSIELIRGPGSVLYGTNAFTGVINLKTRVPDHNEISFSGMTGSYGYYESDVTARGRSGELGYATAFRTAGQQGFPYRMTDDVGVYNSDDDKNKSVSGTMHLEYGGLTFDTFASNLETFYMGTLPRWSASHHEIRTNTVFGNLGYRLPICKTVNVEFNLTHNLQRTRFARYPRGNTDLDSKDWLGEVTLYANPTDRLNLVFGYLQEFQKKLDSEKSNDVLDPPYTFRPQSAYGQGDYKVTDYLKLVAGAQWNKSGYDKCGVISRYGVVLTPFQKWGVKLLRGEAFRAPFALETRLYDPPVLVGSEDLEPETITTYDAQLFYHDEKTYAAVTYFKSTTNGLIVRDTSVNPASFKNGGEQQFDGIELEAKRFLTPHWHVLGSTMYQNNKQTYDLNPSTAPDYMFKLGTGYTWDWGTMSLFYSYFAKPPRLASEVVVNPEPDALNLMSFNLNFDPSKWLDIPKGRAVVTFRIENLFDEEINVPEFNRRGNPNSLPDGSGRMWFMGLKIVF